MAEQKIDVILRQAYPSGVSVEIYGLRKDQVVTVYSDPEINAYSENYKPEHYRENDSIPEHPGIQVRSWQIRKID